MKKTGYYLRALYLLLIVLTSSSFSFSQISTTQVFQEWFKTEGLTDQAYKAKSMFDNTGALYIVGGTINTNGDWDWMVTKYDAISNMELWTVSYDYNALNDYATNVVIDSDCNLYITGSITNDTSMGLDLAIVKFDSSGAFQWVNTFDGGQSFPTYNDGGLDVTLDNSGYLYVAGGTESPSTLKNFITIQYDCATGTEQWVDIRGNSANDVAANIYFDGTDIHVTGLISKPALYKAAYSVRYDVSGSILGGTGLSPSHPDSISDIRDVTVDVNGDIYVAGFLERPWAGTGKDVQVIKFDSLLDIQWAYTLPFYFNDDIANSIRVDDSGYVYVGGVQGYYGDAFLMKLDQSGNQLWIHNYTLGTGVGLEAIEGIAIGSDYNPIVTGYAWMDQQVNFDYYTLKADRDNGNIIWNITYNGIADKDDRAYEIALDQNEDIYVIGQSQDASGVTSNWVTVKYHEHEVYNIPDADTTAPNVDLVSNYGQLINSDTTVNTNVVMYDWQLHTFYEPNRIIQVIGGADTSQSTIDTIVRIDIVLHNDSSKHIFPLNKQENYFNFYTMNTPDGGLNRVPSYQKVYYPSAYPGIDLYSTKNGWGPINQFVVRPFEGAKPSDIYFTIEGADTFYLDSGNLVIVNVLDTLVYLAPECSQVDSSGGYVAPISPSTYFLNGNVVTFTSGTWTSSNLPKIIEMNMGGPYLLPSGPLGNVNWSTYVGGQGADEIQDGYIAPGNTLLHICGYSSAHFVPATSGSLLQPDYVGGKDAIVGKFDELGQRIFVTHFGDLGNDYGNGITIHPTTDMIYGVGYTSSTSLQHITPGAYQNTFQGDTADGLIFSLFGDGSLNWATYFGGSGPDFLNSIAIDPSNPAKMAIVGYTRSDDFPLDSSGVSGTVYCVQGDDSASTGVIIKLDETGFPVWATCLGGTHGNEEQELKDVAIANNGDIYITGFSDGAILPAPASQPFGSYHDGTRVDREAIIAKFDSSCTFIWSTFYGGSGRDEGNSITLTDSGEVFVGGLTGSSNFDTQSYGTAYFDSYRGDWDWFFLKFNTNLGRVWATTYGSDAYDVLNDIHYANGWIYATGYIYSNSIPSLFPVPDNPLGTLNDHFTFDTGTDGGAPMVVALDPSLILRWATCISGINADEGKRVVTDNAEQLYLLTTAISTAYFPLWDDHIAYFNYHHQDSVNLGPNNVTDGAITRFDLPLITILNVEETTIDNNFFLYPNPTTGIVNFKVENGYDNLIVYNLMGKVVYLGTGTNETTLQSIDLGNLESGIYIITLTKGPNRKTGKVIVSH